MTGADGLNPRLLMQDTDKKLFAWFLNRVDARETLRRALGVDKRLECSYNRDLANKEER
jgi:hypothetical protein